MSIDSTAQLLFKIGADSDDAEGNIKRFRTLLGKDLEDIEAEFDEWSTKIFGDLSTVSGAMTAGAAVMGAAIVGLGAFLMESAHKYEEYAEHIAAGSKITGLSAESMSKLAFAAKMTNTDYELLTRGIAFFESAVVKANATEEGRIKLAKELGVSQTAVAAGEKDIMPLLIAAADHYQKLGSATERTAFAREMFSRSGIMIQQVLKLGSEGLREMAAEAERLGVVLSGEDLRALEQHKMATTELTTAMSSFGIAIGREVMPYLTAFTSIMLALPGAMQKTAKEVGGFWGTVKGAVTMGGSDLVAFLKNLTTGADEAAERIQRMAKLLEAQGNAAQHSGEKTKEATNDFRGFTDLLERMQDKLVGVGSEEGKLTADIQRMAAEITKAGDQFTKAQSKGELTGDPLRKQQQDFLQVTQTFPQLIVALWEQLRKKQADQIEAASEELEEMTLRAGQQTLEVQDRLLEMEVAKRRAAILKEQGDHAQNLAWLAAYEQAARQKITDNTIAALEKSDAEINAKIEAQQEHTYAQKVANFNREVDDEKAAHDKLFGVQEAYDEKVDAERKAGLEKIARDEEVAHAQEVARLDQHLESIEREHQTSQQRIVATYAADVAKYSDAEMQKQLLTAHGEAERTQIVKLYAAIRSGLLAKEEADLQQLQNSTGWQGIFGSKFGELIRGDEALMKEWATSSNQSAMLVQVTLEGLKEQGEKTFESLAQGMGGNITHAIVYSKSIGQAMKAALESTLESLAAQAITYAIYSTALGFTDLAEGNEAGATAAFTAAAIWGSVGAAAAIAGRAMQGAPAAAGAGGSGVGQPGAQNAAIARNAQAGAVGGNAGSGGPHVTVNVQGHLVGWASIGELTSAISDAVMNQDVPLTAQNTKTAVVVQR